MNNEQINICKERVMIYLKSYSDICLERLKKNEKNALEYPLI
jgi:hypothetical protein